jgi:asparagine synthase (glutamine-hydrolysing)
MCGIAGFTTFRNAPDDKTALIHRMTDALIHRGPDAEGYFISPQVALGHRRLSIIDIEGGAQPMTLAGERYHLVYNGEIYNYIELQRSLERRGFQFRTRSDTEVLLTCFAADGLKALDQIEGMFALAIWDAQSQELLLARDRIGIKPLYYCQRGEDLVFASEMKALLRHPAVLRELSPLAVSKYFSLGYVPAPSTIFEGVHKLEPGHHLRFQRGQATATRYWDLPLQDNPVSWRNIDECAADLLQLLRDSVQRQLRSDVPVGVFLSGGIDSSTLTALAAAQAPDKLHSFSIGFDQSSYDESPYALQVAKLCGTQHHHQVLTMDDVAKVFPSVMQVADEPLADASILPTYLLCGLAAQHVKVVLGGDGGDELFAGYPAFQAHRVVQRLSFLPTAWRDWANGWARRLPVSHGYTSMKYLAQQFLNGLGMSPEARFLLWMGYCSNSQKKQLFTPEFQQRLLRTDPFEDADRYVRQSGLTNDFERLLYLCMKLYFQDGVLVKVDRASMAHSLEVRVPFLDRDVVEYASRIEPFYKLRGLTTKYVLKRAVRDLLPRNIIRRRKAGFMMPVAAWMGRKPLRDIIEDICAPAALAQTGVLDPAYVRQLLDEHFRQSHDHRKQIWPVLCFMAWWRNYGRG